MSKILNMTPEMIEECKKDFEKSLEVKGALTNGKFNFTKTFESPHKKATVYFTADAWCKMVMLLQEFSKEVAWHGVAARIDNEDADEYIISDILVYPQTVASTTVEMDTEKYAKWLMENDEDERFYNIHMQGHSHVNMAVNPSAVDLNHQEEIVAQLGKDDFYIFMIFNKSFKSNTKIYDMRKNTLFEDGDVEIKLFGGAVSFEEFIKDAKSMVEEKTYTYTTPTYSGGSRVGGAVGGGSYEPYRPPVTPASSSKKDEKPASTWANDKPKSQISDGWKRPGEGDQLTLPLEDESPFGK